MTRKYPINPVRNRNILRAMAHHNMEQAGYKKINHPITQKDDKSAKSRFARLWKQYIIMPIQDARKIAKKKGIAFPRKNKRAAVVRS